MIGLIFAIGSAVAWGASEFFGGLQSKSSRVLTVLWISSVAALLLGVGILLVHQAPAPSLESIWPAIPAGVLSVASLGLIYRAVAIGPAIAVLPTAAIAVVLPIIWGYIVGEGLGVVAAIACVVALVGSLFASGITEFSSLSPADKKRLRASLPLALAASLLVGTYFVLTKEASQTDPYWTVTIARVADLVVVTLAILVVRIFRKPKPGQLHVKALTIAGLAGITDILAELSYALAATETQIGLAAAIASLYPAVTVVLALIIWKEIPSRTQTIGLIVTLIAVASLSML